MSENPYHYSTHYGPKVSDEAPAGKSVAARVWDEGYAACAAERRTCPTCGSACVICTAMTVENVKMPPFEDEEVDRD